MNSNLDGALSKIRAIRASVPRAEDKIDLDDTRREVAYRVRIVENHRGSFRTNASFFVPF